MFRANPNYSDPSIGAIVGNLGTALFGDPGAKARNRALDAQAELSGARTMEVDDNVARLRRQDAALTGMGALFQDALTQVAQGPNVDGSAGVRIGRSPQETRNIIAARAGEIATAYRDRPGAIAEIFRTMGAMSGDDGLARQGMVATGQTPGRDFALTPERADGISARDAAEAFTQATEVANIGQRGAMARETLQEGGRNTRAAADLASREKREDARNDTALERERMRGAAKAASDAARREIKELGFDAQRAGAAEALLAEAEKSGDPAAVERVRMTIVAGRERPAPAGARARQTPDTVNMPPRQLAEIEALTAQRLGLPNLSGIYENLGAEEKLEFADIVSRAYRDGGRNGAAAVASAEEFLRRYVDVQKPGMIGSLFFGPSIARRAQPLTPPAAGGAPPSPASAPAPAAPPQGGMPPPEQRERGKTYETPRGPMQWTGTGWLPVVSQ